MDNTMIHKLQGSIEALFILLTIHWQPVFGIMSAICGVWYYLAMIKQNVVDKNYGGSWKTYIKSIFTL